VVSFTAALYARPGTRTFSTRGFNELASALAGFVRWPDPDATSPAADKESGTPDDPAYVYFRIVPLDQSAVVSALEAGPHDPQVEFFGRTVHVPQAPRNFQTGVHTFNAPLSAVQLTQEPLANIAPSRNPSRFNRRQTASPLPRP
jgi:hypothetical protein